MQKQTPRILAISMIPPDLKAAIEKKYGITEYTALGGGPGRPVPAPGYTIAVTMGVFGIDAPTFAALPDLKLVACNGAGLEKIDLAEAKRRNVAVCHTPDELAEDVADGAIGLTYAIMRRIVGYDRFVREGRWLKERPTPTTRLAGKTMGVVGLGRIGAHIAKRAQAIGMQVKYTGPREKADSGIPFIADIARLAEESDVLALACPGGEATRHLVNRHVIGKLGANGYLVNVSRGSVVEEGALLDALERKEIAGAALDVFATEPNIDPRFLALDNVVLQPHNASITQETRGAMVARLMGDIDAFVNGRPFYNAAA
jgi:lactate dehydrogenase-like 2-hydroxyacid dehydrogenase